MLSLLKEMETGLTGRLLSLSEAMFLDNLDRLQEAS